MAAINGKKIVAVVYYENLNGVSCAYAPFTEWECLHEFMEDCAKRYGYVYTYAGTRDGVAVFTEQHRRNLEKEKAPRHHKARGGLRRSF